MRGSWEKDPRDRKKFRSKGWRNYEYWSRRPMSCTSVSCRAGTNKITKRITHKIERARAKTLLEEQSWQ